MADKSEEEYLNDLLKELLDSTEASNETTDNGSDNTEESEDMDMAMLSRMLSEDNNLSDEDSEESESDEYDSDMDLSIDDLLNEALSDGGSLENADESEITPIVSENNNAFNDLILDDNNMEKSLDNSVSDDTASEIIDEFGSDFFSDLQGIVSSEDSNSTKVDEDAFRQSILDEESKPKVNDDELADLLALDEGMTIDDIPDENDGDKLTEEELTKISGLMNEAEGTDSSEEEIEEKPKKKREKKKREKKPKKEKKEKQKKNEVNKDKKKAEKSPSKDKNSFKDFISMFDDGEDETESKSADTNQNIINELYNDKDTQQDAEEQMPKKVKKEKPPKKKKEKSPKVKKEPKPDEPVERVHIGNGGVAIITILVLVFFVGGYFGVSFLNYKLTINTAKNYYNVCNYAMAYDELSGLDIKAADSYFYEQVHLLMIVDQGNESYRHYMELGMEAEALNALIKAVGRKHLIEEKAEKYNVTDKVNVVYQKLLETLKKYGVDEAGAIDLYRMTDYDEYYNALDKLGGTMK